MKNNSGKKRADSKTANHQSERQTPQNGNSRQSRLRSGSTSNGNNRRNNDR